MKINIFLTCQIIVFYSCTFGHVGKYLIFQPLHRQLMNLRSVSLPLLTLLSVGYLQASVFNVSLINDEEENENFNGMPNITTSNSFTRPIGAFPGSFASLGINDVLVPSTRIINPPIPTPMPESNPTACPSFTSNVIAPIPLDVFNEDNLERPLKKARSEAHALEPDLEKYIQAELSYYGYKKAERRDSLRKTIEFIAKNDYEGFLAHEPVFEAAFKHGYHLFKRGPNKADYMMHYFVRFGATKFLESHSYMGRSADKDTNLESAYEHLIATKPLDVLFVFLKRGRHLKDESVMKAISGAARKRYPDLHFLDYTVFEIDSSGLRSEQFESALKIFKAKTEKDKLKHLTELFNAFKDYIPGPHFSHARFLEVPFRYEEYFLSLDIELQYFLAKLAIVNGDLDKLTRIIELVPELATYNSEGNLFTYAVRMVQMQIIKFFMEIVPELVGVEADDKCSPIGISIEYEKLSFLDVFESSGYDFSKEIHYEGSLLSPIQIAFMLKKPRIFAYFLAKIGPDEALNQLMRYYGDRNKIMHHAMVSCTSVELVLILRDKLGFDLKDTNYFYRGMTGNASIFLETNSFTFNFIKSKLDL